VLTGIPVGIQGGNQNAALVEPPLKPGSATERYDSVTDNAKDPGLFVVFHDAQAYPEYLVAFTGKQ